MIIEEKGKELIKIARENMEKFIKKEETITQKEALDCVEKDIEEELKKQKGVFVTIKTESGRLRGCIGKPYPEQTLLEGIIDASASATKDPRFIPVSEDELNNLKLELTVLDKPEKINPSNLEEAEERIKIGKHGLIIRYKNHQGLLLPQVPVKNKWKLKEFLENTCMKARLSRDSWKNSEVEVLRFNGEVFEE